MTMQSFKPAALFGALLFTGMLTAQTPEPAQAPKPTQAPADQALPNPGTGGGPAQLPNPDPLTREQQDAKVKADAEHISDMQTQVFARQLNLTPTQIQRLKPILAERQQELRDAFSQTDSLVDRRVKTEQIRMETQTKIEGILNPVQKTQYQRLIAAHRGGRPISPNRLAGTPMAPGAHIAPTRPVIQPAGPAPAAPAATPVTPAAPATQAAPAPPAATPQTK
jgi:pilus assembly protein FimV